MNTGALQRLVEEARADEAEARADLRAETTGAAEMRLWQARMATRWISWGTAADTPERAAVERAAAAWSSAVVASREAVEARAAAATTSFPQTFVSAMRVVMQEEAVPQHGLEDEDDDDGLPVLVRREREDLELAMALNDSAWQAQHGRGTGGARVGRTWGTAGTGTGALAGAGAGAGARGQGQGQGRG